MPFPACTVATSAPPLISVTPWVFLFWNWACFYHSFALLTFPTSLTLMEKNYQLSSDERALLITEPEGSYQAALCGNRKHYTAFSRWQLLCQCVYLCQGSLSPASLCVWVRRAGISLSCVLISLSDLSTLFDAGSEDIGLHNLTHTQEKKACVCKSERE